MHKGQSGKRQYRLQLAMVRAVRDIAIVAICSVLTAGILELRQQPDEQPAEGRPASLVADSTPAASTTAYPYKPPFPPSPRELADPSKYPELNELHEFQHACGHTAFYKAAEHGYRAWSEPLPYLELLKSQDCIHCRSVENSAVGVCPPVPVANTSGG